MREAQYHVVASETTQNISDRSGSCNFKSTVHTCQTPKCAICNNMHQVDYCKDFLKMNLKARRTLAFKMNLCFRCLRQGHRVHACPSTADHRHHLLRRNEKKEATAKTIAEIPTQTTYVFTLRVIPIIIKYENKEMTINVLLVARAIYEGGKKGKILASFLRS